MNAIWKKAKDWLEKKHVEHAAVILCASLLCLILIACISIFIHSNMQRKYTAAAKETQAEVYQNLAEMTQLFARVEEPNVDVQNKLIPALRAEYAAAIALNDSLVNGFGEKYAVLDPEQIKDINVAFDEYDQAYRQGMATGLAQDDMAVCMADIQEMVDDYYGPSDEEVIGSLITATTPQPK